MHVHFGRQVSKSKRRRVSPAYGLYLAWGWNAPIQEQIILFQSPKLMDLFPWKLRLNIYWLTILVHSFRLLDFSGLFQITRLLYVWSPFYFIFLMQQRSHKPAFKVCRGLAIFIFSSYWFWSHAPRDTAENESVPWGMFASILKSPRCGAD